MSRIKLSRKQGGPRLQTEPEYSDKELSPVNGSYNPQSSYLSRISPNLTPKGHLKKLLDKSPVMSTRNTKANITMSHDDNSFDNQKTVQGSRSPDFGYNMNETEDRSTEDKSEDYGKKLLDVTHERKHLEDQYKLMENRVKHLMDENSKIKGKIKQTRQQTQNILKNREKILDEEEKMKEHQEVVEKQAAEKKDKILEFKQMNEKRRREKQEQVLNEKLRLVSEVKKQKMKDQELKDELRREEEIKKNEKIWKIALQEKELENSKIYQRIKLKDDAKKNYENKMLDEEKRAIEVEKKIKELEQLEMKLMGDLKNTHMSHISAYEDMEKTYVARITPRSTANKRPNGTNKSTSPWRISRK